MRRRIARWLGLTVAIVAAQSLALGAMLGAAAVVLDGDALDGASTPRPVLSQSAKRRDCTSALDSLDALLF